jgi:hypothetical protein
MSRRENLETAFHALLPLASNEVAEATLEAAVRAIAAGLKSAPAVQSGWARGERPAVQQGKPIANGGRPGTQVPGEILDALKLAVAETSWSRLGRAVDLHENSLRRTIENGTAAPASITKMQAWFAGTRNAKVAEVVEAPANTAEALWSVATSRAGQDRAPQLVAEVFEIDADDAASAFLTGSLPEGVDPVVAAAWAGAR